MSNAIDEVDVIVIGAGGAGLAAAVSAAENGARVLVLESEEGIGGSTAKSAGVLVAAGTSIQESLGVQDSAELMYQHYMDLNQWKVLPGPVWKFCERSAEMVEWLLNLGLRVPAEYSYNTHSPGLTRGGVENVIRGHVPGGQGLGLIQTLDNRRRELNIPLRTSARVSDLLLTEDGIRGVCVGEEELHSKAVIVASGGYARNADLLRKYFPDAHDSGSAFFAAAADGSRGDHLRFAERYGLKVFGHNWGLLLMIARFQRYHHWESGFPPPSRLYVDSTGVRCMDEDAPYAVNQGIWKDRGRCIWAIFDERARTRLPSEGALDWAPGRILEEVTKGVVQSASTIKELAHKIGVPERNLQANVDNWNRYLPNGLDPDFRRHDTLAGKGAVSRLDPIAQGPYYAVQIVPGELICTHTGLQIDHEAGVVDDSGMKVPGLYAAGEAAGGVLGERYAGAGNSVTNGIVFGRLAGSMAAHRASRTL